MFGTWTFSIIFPCLVEAKVPTVNSDLTNVVDVSRQNINDRIKKIQDSEAYITVKDHKKRFPNNPSFGLINPSKSDIGRISKKILDKINQKVIQETKVNQWKNTNTIIAWFKSLPDKTFLSFVNLDIEGFYPSISLNLLQQAIELA